MQERPSKDCDWGRRNLLFDPTRLRRLFALSQNLSGKVQEQSHERRFF